MSTHRDLLNGIIKSFTGRLPRVVRYQDVAWVEGQEQARVEFYLKMDDRFDQHQPHRNRVAIVTLRGTRLDLLVYGAMGGSEFLPHEPTFLYDEEGMWGEVDRFVKQLIKVAGEEQREWLVKCNLAERAFRRRQEKKRKRDRIQYEVWWY